MGEGPQTSENIKSKGALEWKVESGKGSCWLLACWQAPQTTWVLFLTTGNEKREIMRWTVRWAGCPKR